MTITATTIYILVAIVVIVLAPLAWMKIQSVVWKHIVTIGLVMGAGYCTSGAERIAASLNGQGQAEILDAEATAWLAEDTPTSEFVRELLTLESGLQDDVLKIMMGALSADQPEDYARAEGAALGWRIAASLGAKLGSASDESFQPLAVLFAQATDRLPPEPAACSALFAGGMDAWLRDLHRDLPAWGDDIARAATLVIRDARQKGAAGPLDAASLRFFEDRMVGAFTQLSPEELAFALGGGDNPQHWTTGYTCSIFQKLFRYVADQPPPEAGRLWRLMLVTTTSAI